MISTSLDSRLIATLKAIEICSGSGAAGDPAMLALQAACNFTPAT